MTKTERTSLESGFPRCKIFLPEWGPPHLQVFFYFFCGHIYRWQFFYFSSFAFLFSPLLHFFIYSCTGVGLIVGRLVGFRPRLRLRPCRPRRLCRAQAVSQVASILLIGLDWNDCLSWNIHFFWVVSRPEPWNIQVAHSSWRWRIFIELDQSWTNLARWRLLQILWQTFSEAEILSGAGGDPLPPCGHPACRQTQQVSTFFSSNNQSINQSIKQTTMWSPCLSANPTGVNFLLALSPSNS